MTITAYIVDDLEVDRYTARRRLSKSEQVTRIREAADGPIFLDQIEADCGLLMQQQTGPLVLMDINMPILDGFATVDALRERITAQQWDVKPAVYILSSSDAQEDRARAEADGFIQGYIVKPIKPEDIAAILTHMTADL